MLNILVFITLLSFLSTVQSAQIGKPHSKVINLKNDNFDDHLNDPANGLWLLKFYAPWYVCLLYVSLFSYDEF